MNIIDYILKEARIDKWSVLQEQQISNMLGQFFAKNKSKVPEENLQETKKLYFEYAKEFNEIIKKTKVDFKNEKLLLLWLLEQVLDKHIEANKIKEDSAVIEQNLNLYFKNKGEIKKDIYKETYTSLKILVLPFKQGGEGANYKEFLSKPVAQGKEYKIYKVTDIDTCVKIGKGTSWCIQGEDYARQYLEDGPLYLVTKNNHRFALLSFESFQFKDVNDVELKTDVVKDILSISSESKKILDVKKSPELLQFIEEQTEEMCLEAVKQEGLSLQYVKEQTPKICIAAVKQDGHSLKFVKNQTDTICLSAVKQDGHSIYYVKNKTEEICLEAVKQNGRALRYLEEQKYQTEKNCLTAVKQDRTALEFVKDPKMKNLVKQKLNIK
jgi:hypothetical protein